MCREAPRAVPAAIVKELPSARAQQRDHMLEVRGRTRHGAKRRRIERTSPHGEEDYARETAADHDASGCPGVAGDRPRDGGLAPGGAPRVATRSRRLPRRP